MRLSIAICTRNREHSLKKAVSSILSAWAQLHAHESNASLELLICDDGDLSRSDCSQMSAACRSVDADFKYHKKIVKGLYSSRIDSIHLATNDIISFFDDDVELHRDYLRCLYDAFRNPAIGGFGGIDALFPLPSKRYLLYQTIFLQRSRNPGRLSMTGFNGSMAEWKAQQHSFYTEFLAGCNMSFRRSYLQDLPAETIFSGYSICEDVFISKFVSAKAKLLIDPNAIVYHHQVVHSRDDLTVVARSMVDNYYFIFSYFKRCGLYFPPLVWSFIGFAVKALFDSMRNIITGKGREEIRSSLKLAAGYCAGIGRLLKQKIRMDSR